MAERSEEYIDGHLVQKQYIAFIEKKVPENIPIFISFPDNFLMLYSVNQYVKNPLPNVQDIRNIINKFEPNFSYPDHFILVYSYPRGRSITHILKDALSNEEYSVNVMGDFSKGDFSAQVYEVRRTYVENVY